MFALLLTLLPNLKAIGLFSQSKAKTFDIINSIAERCSHKSKNPALTKLRTVQANFSNAAGPFGVTSTLALFAQLPSVKSLSGKGSRGDGSIGTDQDIWPYGRHTSEVTEVSLDCGCLNADLASKFFSVFRNLRSASFRPSRYGDLKTLSFAFFYAFQERVRGSLEDLIIEEMPAMKSPTNFFLSLRKFEKLKTVM